MFKSWGTGDIVRDSENFSGGTTYNHVEGLTAEDLQNHIDIRRQSRNIWENQKDFDNILKSHLSRFEQDVGIFRNDFLGEYSLNNTDQPTLSWTFTGHTDNVQAIAVDKDGSNSYSGGYDNTVRKIDSAGNQVWSFTGHTDLIRGLAVDSSGNVYSGSNDNTARKIDSAGNQVWSFTGHTNLVYAVAVAEDGSNVYTASWDGSVRKLDSSGNEVWSFTGHTINSVRAVAVDSSGNVYSGGGDNTVRKIDSAGNQVWVFTGHTEDVYGIAVDSSGNVYSASEDTTLRKIDSNGNEIWSFTGHTDIVTSVAIGLNGFIYTSSAAPDNSVRKIDSNGNEIWSFTGHTDNVLDVAVDNFSNIYSASWDDTVKKIDGSYDSTDVVNITTSSSDKTYLRLEPGFLKYNEEYLLTRPQLYIAERQLEKILNLEVWHPDPEYVEFLYDSQYDKFQGKIVRRVSGSLTTYEFANGATYGDLSTGGYDTGVELIKAIYDDANFSSTIKSEINGNLETIKLEQTLLLPNEQLVTSWTFTGHANDVYKIAVDSNSNVYTAGQDNTARKIDSAGNETWSFTGHTNAVYDIDVDSSGNVYTASYDNTVRKIDSAGNEVWSFTGHTAGVISVAVESNGSNVYSGSEDNTVRKLDSSGSEVWSFTGHTDFVLAVAVDSSSNVYSGSQDNTVRKIDSAGNEVWSFSGHTNNVSGVTVDSSGNVYSSSYDNTVRKIDSNGNEIWSFTAPAVVYDIALDSNDNVYIAVGNNTAIKLDGFGYEVWTFTGHTDNVAGIAVDSNDFVYTASADDTAKKIEQDTTNISRYIGYDSTSKDIVVSETSTDFDLWEIYYSTNPLSISSVIDHRTYQQNTNDFGTQVYLNVPETQEDTKNIGSFDYSQVTNQDVAITLLRQNNGSADNKEIRWNESGQTWEITGNLTVFGTQTIIETQEVLIEDNLLILNKNQTGTPPSGLVSGIEVERGDFTNYQFLFQESDDTFRIGESGSTQAVATREDNPTNGAYAVWNDTAKRFDTQLLQGVVFYNSSTSFPGSPDPGQIHYRSDLGKTYIWLAVENSWAEI